MVAAMVKGGKVEEGRKTSGVITPPEGGWGWVIVGSCFLTIICSRAVSRCISVFFVEFQLHFEKGYSTTSWINSLIDCTTMFCAPLGGFLESHVSCRTTVILGGLLSSAGLVLGSFATRLEHLYICLGVLSGVGFALSYPTAVAMVGKYFVERRGLAYGIAISGNGIGTFVLAPLFQMLIHYYSWRGALLVVGGFVSNLCVCGALMRPLKPKGGERTMAKLENDSKTLGLKDTEKEAADRSPNQLETNRFKDHRGLLVANRSHGNFILEKNKLGQERVGFLSSFRLPDPSLIDGKIVKCILLSNKLTETVLQEIKLSDPNMPNGGGIEELKLKESMKLKNKAAEKIDDSGLSDANSTDAYHLDETGSAPPDSILDSRSASKFCLMFKERFGFLRSPRFLVLALSIMFLAYACVSPVAYLVPYALSVGLGHQQAAFLMSVFGIGSIIGTFTFGWIADRKCTRRYRLRIFMAALSIEGVCCLFFPLIQSFSLLVPFCAFYGYCEGGYAALMTVVTSDAVSSTDLTAALGVICFMHGVPYLISTPIGGWLIDRTGNYLATYIQSAAFFLLSCGVLATGMLARRCCRTKANSNPTHIYAAAAEQGVV
ncbi:monocarboxylate transporter 12-like [Brachionichthys hirsutus]|uniref:monocarboxylate transporter 12-like n=1 Tax=Brachionichthys hirsutus TaxID=412623 RepID=UPI003604619D